MPNPLSTSNLLKLKTLFEKSGKNETVADMLLRIQDIFPELETAYETYLEDEAVDDSQYRIQQKVAELAIAAQKILLILQHENPDWGPSSSLENAISTHLADLLPAQPKDKKG